MCFDEFGRWCRCLNRQVETEVSRLEFCPNKTFPLSKAAMLIGSSFCLDLRELSFTWLAFNFSLEGPFV